MLNKYKSKFCFNNFPQGTLDNTISVCSVNWRVSSTLQDVHPDQLCSLWTTADLVLQEILSLKRKMDKDQSVIHAFSCFFFITDTSDAQKIISSSRVKACTPPLLLKSKLSPYPGSLQAANLPMESCRALQSCNRYTDQYHECTDLSTDAVQLNYETNMFVISVVSLQQGSTFVIMCTALVAPLLTRHDALIHQLLPGSPLLKPQLQD